MVHILYDNMCDILMKLLRRFIKLQGLENKYGSDLTSVDCTKFQLPNKEIVIAESIRKVLMNLTVGQQKIALLGMRSSFKPTASHLKEKLPVGNELLRHLGCLNPSKRHNQSTVLSIQNIASLLQPKLNSTEEVDE